MLVANKTEKEYFGVKILLEFGQAVNTTISQYIWKQGSEYHKPFTVWNRADKKICSLNITSALIIMVATNLLATVIKFSVGCYNNGEMGD